MLLVENLFLEKKLGMLLKILTDHLSFLWPKLPLFVDKLLLIKAFFNGLIDDVACKNLFNGCLFQENIDILALVKPLSCEKDVEFTSIENRELLITNFQEEG